MGTVESGNMALQSYICYNLGQVNTVSGSATNTPDAANLNWRSAMTTIASPHYYVYVLCRPNGKPFYVGKGKGKRLYSHEAEARRGCKCHKCNVIRKIWKSGGDVQRYIVFTTEIEQEAFEHEIELIGLYGLPSLANQTIGGQGPAGRAPSAKQRAATSAAAKALWADPEFRAKQESLLKARWADPDAHKKQSAQAKISMGTPEHRSRASAQTKASWNDPELRASRIAKAKANMGSPEARQRNSERQTKRYQDPEQRRLTGERSKAYWARRKANAEKEGEV